MMVLVWLSQAGARAWEERAELPATEEKTLLEAATPSRNIGTRERPHPCADGINTPLPAAQLKKLAPARWYVSTSAEEKPREASARMREMTSRITSEMTH